MIEIESDDPRRPDIFKFKRQLVEAVAYSMSPGKEVQVEATGNLRDIPVQPNASRGPIDLAGSPLAVLHAQQQGLVYTSLLHPNQ